MATFRLRILLGNAEMRSNWSIAEALREVANLVEYDRTIGIVPDKNGNAVGEYRITGKRSAEDGS